MTAERAVVHASLVDQLVDRVSERIVSGELAPGSKVTEEGIASEFRVSRTPVREAVKRLAELGLIVIRPRSGLEVVSIDEGDVREITELRAELETFALRLAMRRMTLADARVLEKIASRCEELAAGLPEGGSRAARVRLRRGPTESRASTFRADSRFHLAIAGLSGNRYLVDMLRRLDAKVQLCRMFLCLSDAKIKSSVRFHRRILAAIKQGDAGGAETSLREHIEGISM